MNIDTRESFEIEYCRKSGMDAHEYRKHFVTLPCDCGDDRCPGWACVTANALAINSRMDLYSPKAWIKNAHEYGIYSTKRPFNITGCKEYQDGRIAVSEDPEDANPNT